jgi:hypothetical protein
MRDFLMHLCNGKIYTQKGLVRPLSFPISRKGVQGKRKGEQGRAGESKGEKEEAKGAQRKAREIKMRPRKAKEGKKSMVKILP